MQSSPQLASGGDGLLGWAVAVDDVDAGARRLKRITMIRRAGLSAGLTAE